MRKAASITRRPLLFCSDWPPAHRPTWVYKNSCLRSDASHSEEARYRGRQFINLVRLLQKRIDAGAPGISLAVIAGEHDDRQAAAMGHLADALHQIQAAQSWKFVVNQQQINALVAGQLPQGAVSVHTEFDLPCLGGQHFID